MGNLHMILDALLEDQDEAVLATIVQVEGSAYRKAGASMLFKKNGERVDLLSGGCVEEDLFQRISEMADQLTSALISYDMRAEDDLSWGMGAGCNGMIHIYAERITQEKRRHYERVRECLHSGKAVTAVKQVKSSRYLFLSENGCFGNWPDAPLQDIQRIASTIHLPHFDPSTNMFIQRIEPKPRLILFGAGPDIVPLANLAADTGFSVIVTDWRPAYCTSSLFPKADQLITAFPEQMLSEFQFFPQDAAVVATHHFQHDQAIVDCLFSQHLHYIGLLGSANRTKRLLNGKQPPAHFYSPVGLKIGAEGPEEIAVSVVAEIIQTRKRLAVV
ncbi:XdhC family protein [Bacillus inaquosorum]|uniref:XdhC family protein n=1 Tax=Bacillus inaquosorum TaxID=483913 RepID=UPI00227FF658|nr:XdhC family protein [Bacillus inaquosorum]MCY7759039.1 XdhC family protein [Bacillus inaquosorum]MCY7963761.1 XdhC family protein [Bacillus inaquosorum]MCY8729919.1 XdhC family protein [Bacillus inaquosorum]MCY8850162.1 XdhC family protein [Bacillus inaquosorum]MCY8870925.1 XdhC family protein [Bacillus inaquosorum]